MNTPTQPTLAEIVAKLRNHADGLEETVDIFEAGSMPEATALIATFRHAADRLEALARLAQAVGEDYEGAYTETIQVDGKWIYWFEARERLVK